MLAAIGAILFAVGLSGTNAIPQGPPGDAFYVAPATFALQREGAVIWARPFTGGSALPSAVTNYRVLYQTQSPSGAMVAVSGTVAVPHGVAPARGWPLISWAHGTVGNAPQCAPSRETGPNVEQRMLDGFVRAGYVVAQTDYEGNGTPGIHPYMVATAAAHDVTDIVKAAREIDPQIGRDWIVMGHSEGGAAALATAALGQQIAPSLNLLGVVSFAPFAFPESTLQFELHNGQPNGGLAILALLIEGYSTVDPRVVPSEILEPNVMSQMVPEINRLCIYELMRQSDWSRTIPSTVFRPQGESAVEALYGDLVGNDPAYFLISIPTLLVQGGADTMVAPASTLTVAQQLRRNGTPVEYKAYGGTTHGSVLAASLDDVLAWADARFAKAAAGR